MFLLYIKNLAFSFTVWTHISQHYAVFHGRKKISYYTKVKKTGNKKAQFIKIKDADSDPAEI
jgi:hypothetical protein